VNSKIPAYFAATPMGALGPKQLSDKRRVGAAKEELAKEETALDSAAPDSSAPSTVASTAAILETPTETETEKPDAEAPASVESSDADSSAAVEQTADSTATETNAADSAATETDTAESATDEVNSADTAAAEKEAADSAAIEADIADSAAAEKPAAGKAEAFKWFDQDTTHVVTTEKSGSAVNVEKSDAKFHDQQVEAHTAAKKDTSDPASAEKKDDAIAETTSTTKKVAKSEEKHSEDSAKAVLARLKAGIKLANKSLKASDAISASIKLSSKPIVPATKKIKAAITVLKQDSSDQYKALLKKLHPDVGGQAPH